MIEEYLKESEPISGLIPITNNWEGISFEELEERLELDCDIHCNKNNHK